MNVFVVFKKTFSGQYEDIDVDADIILVTHDSKKAEDLVALAKRFGVDLYLRECPIE